MNNNAAFAGGNQQQQGRGVVQQAPAHVKQEQQDAPRGVRVTAAPPNQVDATAFTPLVRPGAGYPHGYPNIHNPRPDHAYRPQPAFFNHQQDSSALPFTVALDPNDIAAWNPDTMIINSGIPQYNFSDSSDPHQVIAQGTSAMQHRGPPSPPSGIPFPPPHHPSQHLQQPLSSFSPHVFTNNNQLSVPQSRPASNSASPSPGPPRHPFPGGPKTQPRIGQPIPNGPSEPADAPWNLVPYQLPFTGRNRASPGGAAGPTSGAVAGPTGNSLFLRSPTPTKRQRTNQACEKCRDRKAKCNGARPTCQRCASRGLPCEYAKERRMRGPNRTGNGHQADSGSPHNRTASSPARTTMHHHQLPQVSVHISTGQGTSPPPGSGASPASARPSPPPGAIGHQRKMLESWPPGARGPAGPSVPVYRTVHVAHSHPDLHLQHDLSGPPSLVPANPMQGPAMPYSRPRSHTTPHPLVVGPPARPSPLYNQIRSETEFSSGENSEPPSATSSHFGVDVHGMYQPGAEAPRGPAVYGGDEMHINPHLGMLGLSNDGSNDTAHPTPLNAVGPSFASGADAYTAYTDSPDSYKPLDFTDDGSAASGDITTASWPPGFGLNVNTSGLSSQGTFSTGTQSASASSNPSTSSPGPISFRSHVSQHSGSSIQDTMGWNNNATHFTPNGQPGSDNSFPNMAIDTPPINFPISPKLETPFHENGLGVPGPFNYPWTSVDMSESNSDSFPRIAVPQRDAMSHSPDQEFRAWFANDVEDGGQTRKSSSGDGSVHAVDAAVNGKVRNIAVLEVHD